MIEDLAEGVDIDSLVEVARAEDLLGRHVLRCADHLELAGGEARVGDRLLHRLGDPEVDHLHDRPAVVVGGTAQAAVLLNRGARTVGRRDLARLARRLCRAPLERRRNMMLFDPGRAEIICGGLVILSALAEQAADDRLFLSGTALRKALSEGGDVPSEFSRKEVLDILREYYSGLEEEVEVKMHGHATGDAK